MVEIRKITSLFKELPANFFVEGSFCEVGNQLPSNWIMFFPVTVHK